MGLNDTREQLEACKTQSVADERRIAELEGQIAQLRELCDDLETPGTSFGATKRLRAILDPAPVTARGASPMFDREKADRVLQDTRLSVDGVLDALEECVRPQGIDRDALIADAMRMLYEHSPSVDHEYDREEAEELVDRMLLHGSYLTAAPGRDIIAAAIQTDFDVRNSAALRVADEILALVRPVEGVTLAPEDTALIAECLSHITTAPRGFYSREKQEHARALVARLEAAQ